MANKFTDDVEEQTFEAKAFGNEEKDFIIHTIIQFPK